MKRNEKLYSSLLAHNSTSNNNNKHTSVSGQPRRKKRGFLRVKRLGGDGVEEGGSME